MIVLHQFDRLMPGVPNGSPFCVKLETYLRLTETPYRVEVVGNPSSAPKKRAPYIECDGETVADSTLVIDYLKARKGIDLDAHLTDEERAISHLAQRTMEERLYWVMMYSRWIEPANWPVVRTAFFQPLPAPVRGLIATVARRSVVARIKGHGIGLHSREEIYALGAADHAALSTLLGEKPFFFGEEPSTVDATLFGFLVNILLDAMPNPLREAALTHPNLVTYTDRMQAMFDGKANVEQAA